MVASHFSHPPASSEVEFTWTLLLFINKGYFVYARYVFPRQTLFIYMVKPWTPFSTITLAKMNFRRGPLPGAMSSLAFANTLVLLSYQKPQSRWW